MLVNGVWFRNLTSFKKPNSFYGWLNGDVCLQMTWGINEICLIHLCVIVVECLKRTSFMRFKIVFRLRRFGKSTLQRTLWMVFLGWIWILGFVRICLGKNKDWTPKFIMIAWHIWCTRNKKIIERRFIPREKLVHKINKTRALLDIEFQQNSILKTVIPR